MNTTLHYHVIGLMSGTSLDGVDMAYCKISETDGCWSYEIIHAETMKYPDEWKKTLDNLQQAKAFHFQCIHQEYGYYLGSLLKDFIKKYDISPDFVSSHGHTVFHTDVEGILTEGLLRKLTVQIGAGSAIAAESGLSVVCDFRSLDTALGGQGAPLVPIGDQLLFGQYDYCLNLGGFANVSYSHKGTRVAYDIGPANIVLNDICRQSGKEYDEGGMMASYGTINTDLLKELNDLAFYRLPAHQPKSLGKEWVVQHVQPLLEKYKIETKDSLSTLTEHIAIQVANALNVGDEKSKKVIVSGGGTYNCYLIERIKERCKHEIIVPDKSTIEFKEALIFAFLGVLRMRNEVNCIKSVTAARQDNVGGAVYWMK